MVGFAGFGRTAASLINLEAADHTADGAHHWRTGACRVRWSAARWGYLLAQPVGRLKVFLGKYLGLALSLLASLAMGFGISGLVMAPSAWRRRSQRLRHPGAAGLPAESGHVERRLPGLGPDP